MNKPTRNPDLSFTVRHARPEDVEPLSHVWSDFMEEHQRVDVAFSLSLNSVQHWIEIAQESIGRNDTFLLAAMRDNPDKPESKSMLGFCLGWIAKNPPVYALSEIGFVSELAVLPSFHGRGIGHALLNEARSWFKRHGVVEFQLSTAVWNLKAQRFWEKEGGKPLLIRYSFPLT